MSKNIKNRNVSQISRNNILASITCENVLHWAPQVSVKIRIVRPDHVGDRSIEADDANLYLTQATEHDFSKSMKENQRKIFNLNLLDEKLKGR